MITESMMLRATGHIGVKYTLSGDQHRWLAEYLNTQLKENGALRNYEEIWYVDHDLETVFPGIALLNDEDHTIVRVQDEPNGKQYYIMVENTDVYQEKNNAVLALLNDRVNGCNLQPTAQPKPVTKWFETFEAKPERGTVIASDNEETVLRVEGRERMRFVILPNGELHDTKDSCIKATIARMHKKTGVYIKARAEAYKKIAQLQEQLS